VLPSGSGANLAREYVTHFAGVAGDDGIGAGMSSTVTADSNQRDAVARPLRAELVGGKFSGKPRKQVAQPTRRKLTAKRIKGASRPSASHGVSLSWCIAGRDSLDDLWILGQMISLAP
jgi:hypothetical protein